MACIENCDISSAQVTLAAAAGTFNIVTFSAEGEAVSFDETETNIDRKYTSEGDVIKAGHNFIRQTFSVTAPCDADTMALWQAFKQNPMGFCGVGSVTSDCCSDEFYKTLDLVSVDRPSLSDTVEYFTFNFEGVPS